MNLTYTFEGFVLARQADGVSPDTIRIYRWGLKKLTEFFGERELESIAAEDLRNYFSNLRTTTDLSELSLQVARRVIRAF